MDPITGSAVIGGALSTLQAGKEVYDTYQNAKSQVKAHLGTASLIDIAKMAQVQPITMVDASIMHLPEIDDVMQSLQSIFSAYWLQAVQLTGTKINGVNVAQTLAPLNPAREAYADWRMDLQSYQHRLPTRQNRIATEATIDDRNSDDVADAANLSLGKMYSVTVGENQHRATVRVSIRLMCYSIPSATISNIFTLKNKFDTDFGERWFRFRAGELKFWRDLVFCNDLIDKHRNTLIQDKSGVYQRILERENKNRTAGLMSNTPSLATASNLAVIGQDTAELIEHKIGGHLKSASIRKEIFDTTNLMILAVVEPQWQRVKFYFRGMEEFTDVSFKQIKRMNGRGDGADVTEILKLFMQGSGQVL